eukprot:177115-Prymnesium_polylepis.1
MLPVFAGRPRWRGLPGVCSCRGATESGMQLQVTACQVWQRADVTHLQRQLTVRLAQRVIVRLALHAQHTVVALDSRHPWLGVDVHRRRGPHTVPAYPAMTPLTVF